MTLDLEAAAEAIRRDVAQPLGMDVPEAAWAVQRIVNADMANATRRVLSSYGAEVLGPALVEEPFTVVVVPPGGTAVLDRQGNYELANPGR